VTEEMIDNRARFMEDIGIAKMVAANTHYQRTERELITDRPPGHQKLYRTHGHNKRINNTWNNSICNIENKQTTIVNSDHTLQIAELMVKMAKKNDN
jgi:ribosomal protein L17